VTDQDRREVTNLFEKSRLRSVNKHGPVRFVKTWLDALNEFETARREGARNLLDGPHKRGNLDHAAAVTKRTAPARCVRFGMKVCDIEISPAFGKTR
jgi:hypothetical protein